MSQTKNYQLFITSDGTTTFQAWREAVAGDNDGSNMSKIDAALYSLQDQITNYKVDVDDALDENSENPVQNKVIAGAITQATTDAGEALKQVSAANAAAEQAGKDAAAATDSASKAQAAAEAAQTAAGNAQQAATDAAADAAEALKQAQVAQASADAANQTASGMGERVEAAEAAATSAQEAAEQAQAAADKVGDVSNKAEKSVSVTLTLAASGWTGSAAPWVQTLAVSNLGATQNGTISVAASASTEQREAARNALLAVTGQSAGALIISADGTKPTLNIPVTLVMLG